MTNYIEVTIDLLGGDGWGKKARAARALGVSPVYLQKMLKQNHVPVEQCRKFEVATGKRVTVHMLRPDIFGPPKRIKH